MLLVAKQVSEIEQQCTTSRQRRATSENGTVVYFDRAMLREVIYRNKDYLEKVCSVFIPNQSEMIREETNLTHG